MKTRVLLVALLAVPFSVFAADVNGTWKAEFETQRGLQKYTFTLKQDGTKVTGKVNVDTDGEKREVELKDGKIEGESVTFAEPLSIQGNEILMGTFWACSFLTSAITPMRFGSFSME